MPAARLNPQLQFNFDLVSFSFVALVLLKSSATSLLLAALGE